MTHLELTQVGMEFRTANEVFSALKNVNLKVKKGEYVSLIGHSGCGKSTVLNIIAGIYKATSGGVILNNREVNTPGPDRAFVFQNHSLMPWLNVYDNVALAVNQVFKSTKTKQEKDEWIKYNLELVNMSHAINKLPDEISGGMKQRVGIARALSMEPEVLLLDEPFGALDALTRANLQDSVTDIQDKLGNTMMMVTHDVDEAILLSDKIVMMTKGPNATIGKVLDIQLERPRNRIEITKEEKYNEYRNQVIDFLYSGNDN